MPTEAKEWADSTSEFHDYAFFKVQQGAGTPIYTLKSTVYATLKFDETERSWSILLVSLSSG